jgi:hypothetical protein
MLATATFQRWNIANVTVGSPANSIFCLTAGRENMIVPATRNWLPRAAMYLRFEPCRLRLVVGLVTSHMMAGRKVRQERLGSLGSVVWSDPISLSERLRFWANVSARYRALAAKRPNAVLLADEERIRAAIDKRIPGPRTEEEGRLFLQAAIVNDMTVALAQHEDGEDALAAAALRMLELARERRPNRIEGRAQSP